MSKVEHTTIKNMDLLLNQLLEKAKQDKKSFRKLKELSVECQQLELAANLREIEKDLFPESEEVKKAKERGDRLNLLFRMIELTVSDDVAWMVEQAIIFDINSPGQFSLKDACALIEKRKRIFE
jgi:hypothetical protein